MPGNQGERVNVLEAKLEMSHETSQEYADAMNYGEDLIKKYRLDPDGERELDTFRLQPKALFDFFIKTIQNLKAENITIQKELNRYIRIHGIS